MILLEGWRRFNGRYWSLESRLEGERATLKYPVLAQFEREIVGKGNQTIHRNHHPRR
jgi:hypothetical protein